MNLRSMRLQSVQIFPQNIDSKDTAKIIIKKSILINISLKVRVIIL